LAQNITSHYNFFQHVLTYAGLQQLQRTKNKTLFCTHNAELLCF